MAFDLPLLRVFGLLAALPLSMALTRTYSNCKVLDSTTEYQLSWTVSGSNIQFGLTAKADGFIALGLSGTPTMSSSGAADGLPSDIFMGFSAAADAAGSVDDRHTFYWDVPLVDTSNSLTFVSRSEANGYLTLEFDRPLASADNQDRSISPGVAQWVLYSLCQSNSNPALDCRATSKALFGKHSSKGYLKMDFGAASSCTSHPEDVSTTFEIDGMLADFDEATFLAELAAQTGVSQSRFRIESKTEVDDWVCPDAGCFYVETHVNNQLVPSQDTTYGCYTFELPYGDYHAVRFKGLPDNPSVIHHMLFWAFQPDATPAPGTLNQFVYPCQMPQGGSLSGAWAPGGVPLEAPAEAGFPLGWWNASNAAGWTGVRYATINYHYDNPTMASDKRDSSGFGMWLTPNKRSEDAATVILGVPNDAISLSPGQTHTHQWADICFSALGTVNIFATFGHAHKFGRQVWLEHWRAGTRLPNLNSEPSYDFNSQKFSFLQQPWPVIGHGDCIKQHCIWDTRTATQPVFGGEATEDEMCLTLIALYPKNAPVVPTSLQSYSECDCAATPFDSPNTTCDSIPACNADSGGNCAVHTDCASCAADSTCGWCYSGRISGCFQRSRYRTSCYPISTGSQPHGIWIDSTNSTPAALCAANSGQGTTCSPTNNNCTGCAADTGCKWCDMVFSGGAGPVGYCLDQRTTETRVAAGAVCNAIGGQANAAC